MKLKAQLELLDKVKQKIKKSKTIQKMFKDENLSLDIIDLVPMCFSDLEVSARTQHGIIYFNKQLINKPEEIDHYMVHELTHVLQQCFSDGPTQGSNDSNYLDNPYEQEGFQNQTKFLSETEGKETAEDYIDRVLDHHKVPKKEKEDKKDELLVISSKKRNQLSLPFMKQEKKPIEEEPANYPPSYVEGGKQVLDAINRVLEKDSEALKEIEERNKKRLEEESRYKTKRRPGIDPESRERIEKLMKELEELEKIPPHRRWDRKI